MNEKATGSSNRGDLNANATATSNRGDLNEKATTATSNRGDLNENVGRKDGDKIASYKEVCDIVCEEKRAAQSSDIK